MPGGKAREILANSYESRKLHCRHCPQRVLIPDSLLSMRRHVRGWGKGLQHTKCTQALCRIPYTGSAEPSEPERLQHGVAFTGKNFLGCEQAGNRRQRHAGMHDGDVEAVNAAIADDREAILRCRPVADGEEVHRQSVALGKVGLHLGKQRCRCDPMIFAGIAATEIASGNDAAFGGLAHVKFHRNHQAVQALFERTGMDDQPGRCLERQ
ncbi:conserved hypothetical protein, partial [Ricinus communis]